MENNIIEEIKFSRDKKMNLKTVYDKSTLNRGDMRLEDFHQLIEDIHMKDDMSKREIDQLFKYIDVNKNDKITFTEFSNVFKRKRLLGI
jgi:Ca2+-binding EF-hand superfamily protein